MDNLTELSDQQLNRFEQESWERSDQTALNRIETERTRRWNELAQLMGM